MPPVAFDIAFEIVAILLSVAIILRTVPLLKQMKNPMTVAIFLFATMSLLLSFAYWLTYTLLRPDVRMPFAANEIGENAWFLLLASALGTVFRKNEISAIKEMLCTALFAAASVALWIAWSGEWLQDIISGIVFGYFLLVCVRALKQTAALKKTDWRMLALSCAVIIVAQAGTFFVPDKFKQPLDLFCYVLMFAVLIWLFAKSVLIKNDTKAALAMSFGVCAFSHSTLYMSAGWFYLAALAFCLAALPLMFVALKREVTA